MQSEVVCEGVRFGEGPVWYGDGMLVVTSVADGALLRVDVASGDVSRFADTGGGANGAALAADGSMLVTQNGGIDFAALGLYDVIRPSTARRRRDCSSRAPTAASCTWPTRTCSHPTTSRSRPTDACSSPIRRTTRHHPSRWAG